MTDLYAARRVCAATIQCALKDAGGRKGADRVEALAWLASTRATKYLDLLEMPQSTLLMRSGWMEWAEQVLNSLVLHYDDSRDEEYACILLGYKYLYRLQESQYVQHEDQIPENRLS